MKHRRGLGVLLIAMVLLTAACGSRESGGQTAADPETPPQAMQPSDVKEKYQTSVFLGDSITEGLVYHDVLNEANVLAGAGKTAVFTLMEDDVDRLVSRKPEHIYIQLGSTDILWPTDNPLEYSLANYERLIDTLKDRLPGASISILSVTPVTAEAEKQEPRYSSIPDYNQGLQDLAAKKEVNYIDLTSLVARYPDLYDADGIHFQAGFYPILLQYLDSPE